MKNPLFAWFCSIPFLLLLPCLSVIGFQGADTALKNKSCGVEDFLPVILEKQISADMEAETIKCQAVIARSNLYRHLDQGEEFLSEIAWAMGTQGMIAGQLDLSVLTDNLGKNPLGKFRKASEETEGIVLQEKGNWRLVPYHELSNGKTRNGEEVFHDSAYAYLQSVESERDQEAEGYLNSRYLTTDQVPKNLKISYRDSVGYVLSLSADGKPIEGEAFRDGMGLSSADFTIQKIGNQYRFLCKGKGHGLGLSQYGANELAKEGVSFEEILKYYFPALDLMKIEMGESS